MNTAIVMFGDNNIAFFGSLESEVSGHLRLVQLVSARSIEDRWESMLKSEKFTICQLSEEGLPIYTYTKCSAIAHSEVEEYLIPQIEFTFAEKLDSNGTVA